MDDFLSALMDLGGEKGGWRSPWAIFGLLLGAGIGAYLGWTGGGLLAAAGSTLTGGFLGWVAFVMLKGLLRFIVLFLIIGAVVVGWYWLTGSL